MCWATSIGINFPCIPHGQPLYQFVDLCILLGCDYCDKIVGLGPQKALKLIQEHHTIEQVVLHINREVLDRTPYVPLTSSPSKYIYIYIYI